jgi:uncharacterized protein (DUF1330 family)
MYAYVLLEIEVVDREAYTEYLKLAPATVKQYGGRYLIRGGAVTPVEGDWNPARLVLLEFPTVEQAKRWLNSAEYQKIAPIRQRATKSRAVIVEGHEGDKS